MIPGQRNPGAWAVCWTRTRTLTLFLLVWGRKVQMDAPKLADPETSSPTWSMRLFRCPTRKPALFDVNATKHDGFWVCQRPRQSEEQMFLQGRISGTAGWLWMIDTSVESSRPGGLLIVQSEPRTDRLYPQLAVQWWSRRVLVTRVI